MDLYDSMERNLLHGQSNVSCMVVCPATILITLNITLNFELDKETKLT